MFTKAQIEQMSEAEFQNSVLIPLFRGMGFRDVTAFGGGSQELGKDIVMWKPGDLEERVNYAVVVKAVSISGKAKGSGTASEVLNQIRQCFTTDYPDPVTAQPQTPDRCFVVSSKLIKKESINSIEGQLRDAHFDRIVSWLHPGTNLYHIIEKHLPHQTIFEKLADVKKALDDPMAIVPYRIVADSDSRFSIVPKHEKATEEMPFEIKGRFVFDTSTPEGLEALNRFQDHFKKGKPVEIDGSNIESFDFPDFLPDFLKPHLTEGAKLLLGAQRHEGGVALRIDRVLVDGTRFDTGRLEFEVVQAGSEEVTLSNHKQTTPLRFTITVNAKESMLTLNIQCVFQGFNVLEHLKAVEFLMAMSHEGEVSIYRADADLLIYRSNHWQEPINQELGAYVELIKALVAIQERTKVIMAYPEAGPRDDEISTIFTIRSIVTTGKATLAKTTLSVNVALDTARKQLSSYHGETRVPMHGTFPEAGNFTVFGNKLNLGRAVLTADVWLTKDDFKRIETEIEQGVDPLQFDFQIDEDAGTLDYLDWGCEDRHTRISVADSPSDESE